MRVLIMKGVEQKSFLVDLFLALLDGDRVAG